MTNRLLALAAAALLLLCSGCGAKPPADPAPPAQSVADASVPDISVPDSSAPVPSEPVAPPVDSTAQKAATPEPPAPPAEEAAPPEELPPAAPDAPDPEPPVEEAVPPEALPEEPEEDVPAVHIPETPIVLTGHDFSAPVPESAGVDADYFADAAFVGDSRTEGFWLYSGVKQGKLLSATGLTVFSVNNKTAINTNQTVLQALKAGNFSKIYLSFGINELGYIDTDAFIESYCDLIDAVRAAHPGAVIYIQNLIPVNDAQARASGHKGHVNCDRIRLYNEFIAQIARDKQVPLLDLYSAFAVDGQLPAEDSRDGIHLLPAACKRQLNYLMTHTVAPAPTAPVEPTPDPPIETEVTEI